jgi:hypothetical protein
MHALLFEWSTCSLKLEAREKKWFTCGISLTGAGRRRGPSGIPGCFTQRIMTAHIEASSDQSIFAAAGRNRYDYLVSEGMKRSPA